MCIPVPYIFSIHTFTISCICCSFNDQLCKTTVSGCVLLVEPRLLYMYNLIYWWFSSIFCNITFWIVCLLGTNSPRFKYASPYPLGLCLSKPYGPHLPRPLQSLIIIIFLSSFTLSRSTFWFLCLCCCGTFFACALYIAFAALHILYHSG